MVSNYLCVPSHESVTCKTFGSRAVELGHPVNDMGIGVFFLQLFTNCFFLLQTPVQSSTYNLKNFTTSNISFFRSGVVKICVLLLSITARNFNVHDIL